MGYWSSWEYQPYVSVAEKRRKGLKFVEKKFKNKTDVLPIAISGRKIARTFWGEAWCENLERYSDYENRLPRGRTYVRNGSVIHLNIKNGSIESYVSGSEVYHINITINPLSKERWNLVKKRCSGRIGSVLELLTGKIDRGVMEIITAKDGGLFPSPKEIKLSCSCPDSAYMCKHVAATLYGVAARLDEKPELFFTLRNVDHRELLSEATRAISATSNESLDNDQLTDLFGIDIQGNSSEKNNVLTAQPCGKTIPIRKKVTSGKKMLGETGKRLSTKKTMIEKATNTVAKPKKPSISSRNTEEPLEAVKKKIGKSTSSIKKKKVVRGAASVKVQAKKKRAKKKKVSKKR
ncbi:MAG: SWIM zinc finger family protein [Oligoflexales bacterium]|nr:SWIM zinc finger family protein [Oligoflexales bacterium]